MKHFVICENDCLVEGMTKEEVISAIATATGYVPTGEEEAVISQIINQNKGKGVKIWFGTRVEYNALAEKDENTIYHITDDKTAVEAYNKAVEAEEIARASEEIATGAEAKAETAQTTADDAIARLVDMGGKLLWKNASPTSDFGLQDITLSNAYTHYAIFSDDACSNNITIVSLGNRGNMIGFYTEGSARNIQRNVYLNTDGVLRVFDCNRRDTYGGNAIATNNHLIPVAVYGFNL